MASYIVLGIAETPLVIPTMLFHLSGRRDLTALHNVLLKAGYKDEEGAENEVGCERYPS